MVVFYHLHPDGWLTSSGLARNGWMFVDFFFVLSGFVIAASYGERLANGYSIPRFMALRLGRVYPLHLFVIVVIMLLNIVAIGAPITGEFTASSLFANLLLLHGFGVTDRLTWNHPSWSIAVEVWAYLSFALLVHLRQRIEWWLFAVIALVCFVTLALASTTALDTTFQLGFVRCLLGFSLGVIVWLAHMRLPQHNSTGIEVAVVTLIAIYVSLVGEGPLTFLAPPAFAIAVLIFAREGGLVSSVLRARPFRALGLLSYAIYMMHIVALARYFDLLGIIGRATGTSLVTTSGQNFATDDSAWGIVRVELLTLGALAFTVFLAWFAWRFVEMPARAWSRRKFAQRDDAPLPSVAK